MSGDTRKEYLHQLIAVHHGKKSELADSSAICLDDFLNDADCLTLVAYQDSVTRQIKLGHNVSLVMCAQLALYVVPGLVQKV